MRHGRSQAGGIRLGCDGQEFDGDISQFIKKNCLGPRKQCHASALKVRWQHSSAAVTYTGNDQQ